MKLVALIKKIFQNRITKVLQDSIAKTKKATATELQLFMMIPATHGKRKGNDENGQNNSLCLY